MASSRLPIFLSMTAGSVDTVGFLALKGLFAAHVTGNFVTLTSSIIQGDTPWIVAKPLVLPGFLLTVALIRLAGNTLAARWSGREVHVLFTLEVLSLLIAFFLVVLARTGERDEWLQLLPGGFLVLGMAIQTAAQRIYLPHFPPTTVMTGTASQLAIDTVDICRTTDETLRQTLKKRMKGNGMNILAFIAGCAVAAALFDSFGNWCFIAPPVIGAFSLLYLLYERRSGSTAA